MRKDRGAGFVYPGLSVVGDPVLEGPDPADRQRGGRKRAATAPAGYFRNGLADVRAVRELTPLPDTAEELRTMTRDQLAKYERVIRETGIAKE